MCIADANIAATTPAAFEAHVRRAEGQVTVSVRAELLDRLAGYTAAELMALWPKDDEPAQPERRPWRRRR